MSNAILILITAAALSGAPTPSDLLTGDPLAGGWGGDGVILTVRSDGARLQADCARGNMDGAIKVDSEGRFAAKGRFEQYSGGPQRADEPASPPLATYEGRIVGDILTLKVKAGSNPVARTYTLRRGAHPKLMRCL